jgi:hypothetical protein
MSSPFIYICIPTYKPAYLFKKLLYSIIMQIAVLVNYSPDDSIEVVVNAFISRDELFNQDW